MKTDSFVEQARIDQKNAVYPGCRLGLMECGSLSCGCDEDTPHPDFVTARANFLKLKTIPSLPERIVNSVLEELGGRRGIGAAFDSVDDVMTEIKASLRDVVAKELVL